MNGIWVQSYGVETAQQANAQLDRFRSVGIDTLFYNVHERGARYNSAFYPLSTSMKKGFDALGYLIERGHARDMKVFAWLSFGADLFPLNPAWSVPEGDFTDFSKADARKRMGDVVADIVAKYAAIDGFALDYMRHRGLVDEVPQRYAAEDVTDAVARIHAAAQGRTIGASVKAYKNDWVRWAQNWPNWLRDGLIDWVMPMAYNPLDNVWGDFASHVNAWLGAAAREKIISLLSVMDTDQQREPLKPASQLVAEIAFFRKYKFADFAWFDQRASDEQLAAIKAALLEGTSGMAATLLTMAEALESLAGQQEALAAELREKATGLRTIAESCS